MSDVELRDCATAGRHPPHEWPWDGGRMWCSGKPSPYDRGNARGEPMDDFMRRTAHTGVPNSLRRMAWVLDKPLAEVVEAFTRATEEA